MYRTAQIRARCDPELKRGAEEVLAQLGLTPSAAITMYYRQIVLHQGLPFPIALPGTASEPVASPRVPSELAAQDALSGSEMDAVIARLDELTTMRFG